MDNRILNINGEGLQFLTLAIELSFFKSKDHKNPGIKGWCFEKQKGIILFDYISDTHKNIQRFLAPVTPDTAAKIVFDWLDTDEAKTVPCESWDADADHDGSNGKGWRVYVEEWGHIKGYQYGVICAIKPAFMWYGK